MKNVMRVALVGVLVGGLAAVAWAQANQEPPQETPGKVNLKVEMTPIQYNRLIKPVEKEVGLAEKALKDIDKEMEKPAEKRNNAKILQLKESAAGHYLNAALLAQKAVNSVTKEKLKTGITDQHLTPNRQKSVDLYLELAATARDRNDLRRAVALYNKVLQIDPQNTAAQDALKQIEEQNKQSQEDDKKLKRRDIVDPRTNPRDR